jgi:hypothetical protein
LTVAVAVAVAVRRETSLAIELSGHKDRRLAIAFIIFYEKNNNRLKITILALSVALSSGTSVVKSFSNKSRKYSLQRNDR